MGHAFMNYWNHKRCYTDLLIKFINYVMSLHTSWKFYENLPTVVFMAILMRFSHSILFYYVNNTNELKSFLFKLKQELFVKFNIYENFLNFKKNYFNFIAVSKKSSQITFDSSIFLKTFGILNWIGLKNKLQDKSWYPKNRFGSKISIVTIQKFSKRK